MADMETPLQRAKRLFSEKIESEIRLKINTSENAFMREAMMKQGSELASESLFCFFEEYFRLLWKLKGMKIHSGKSPEDVLHILTEYLPDFADLKLMEIYNSIGVDFSVVEQAEEYYGRLEEG